ncbi:extracellular solute-binding protein [Lacibacterium aquatile]|uniref:Extracellular solute-binding protein n=1 Tax=Lacibacterium aquatile TaxID=1168082 RepID=A0ABW5DND1_9PROT
MRLPALALFATAVLALPATAEPVHGIAMHGTPKYQAGFTHFDYVNPDAPKGGEVRLGVSGTFDSLNPFILAGKKAVGAGLTFDTLGRPSADEPFSYYGLIAQTIDIAPDRTSVTFALRPEARFHDGSPITAEDVEFTFQILREKGLPFFRSYYGDVVKVDIEGPHKVTFRFKDGNNGELPLILMQMPILSKAYYSKNAFDKTSLEPPLGSGPYKIASVDAGKSIVLSRVPDYWGKDLPVSRGHANFGTLRYEYFRDDTIALEAFFAGQIDWRRETSALSWAQRYDKPPVADGRIKKEAFETEQTAGMQGFGMNLRRPQFQDRDVRRAIILALDFEWSNKTLFFGLYKRTRSFFDNSDLGATGLPSPAELKLLEPWRGKIPDEVFTTEYKPPVTDGSGNIRPQLREALALLKKAGWEPKNGKLTNAQGQEFVFEILLENPAYERIALPFTKNLELLGIKANVRVVDPAQYEERMKRFDFDMTVELFAQSDSPGNEQRDFFGSAAADEPGGRNTLGIKSPAIDALIEQVITAKSREDLQTATKALDRVLQWGYYTVPHWNLGKVWVAHWDMFGRTDKRIKAGVDINTWWIDPKKAAAIGRKAN